MLLDRFRQFKIDWTESRLDWLQVGFARLAPRLETIRREAEEYDRKVASRFNIFHLLGMVYDEVNTHSAFLKNLLDPAGSHAQQHLFLDTFLQMCSETSADFPLPNGDLRSGRWRVTAEKATSYGRLDLVVANLQLGYLLVIENKVYAQDQENQLARYARWMREQLGRYPQQVLIYLTPDGRASSTSRGHDYCRISYHEDISGWLEAVLLHVQASKLRETIRQYLEILPRL